MLANEGAQAQNPSMRFNLARVMRIHVSYGKYLNCTLSVEAIASYLCVLSVVLDLRCRGRRDRACALLHRHLVQLLLRRRRERLLLRGGSVL